MTLSGVPRSPDSQPSWKAGRLQILFAEPGKFQVSLGTKEQESRGTSCPPAPKTFMCQAILHTGSLHPQKGPQGIVIPILHQ